MIMSPSSVTDATHCLSLHYHMYGSGMGKFSVMTYSPDAGYWLYDKVEGNQGNQWKHMEVNLQLTSNTRVRSRVVTLFHAHVTVTSEL